MYILGLKMTLPIFFKLKENNIFFILYEYIIMISLKYIAWRFEKSFVHLLTTYRTHIVFIVKLDLQSFRLLKIANFTLFLEEIGYLSPSLDQITYLNV